MQDQKMTVAERGAKTKAAQKTAFDKWMDQPACRLMLSMLPPMEEKREVLETLLRETFNAGWDAGGGSTAGMFLEAIFTGMEKRDRFGPLRLIAGFTP